MWSDASRPSRPRACRRYCLRDPAASIDLDDERVAQTRGALRGPALPSPALASRDAGDERKAEQHERNRAMGGQAVSSALRAALSCTPGACESSARLTTSLGCGQLHRPAKNPNKPSRVDGFERQHANDEWYVPRWSWFAGAAFRFYTTEWELGDKVLETPADREYNAFERRVSLPRRDPES